MHIVGTTFFSRFKTCRTVDFRDKVFRKHRRRQNQNLYFCARICIAGGRVVFAGCNVWLNTAATFRKLTA
jgi:hypothetical protein